MIPPGPVGPPGPRGPLGPLGPLHADPEPPPGRVASGRPPKICIYPGCTRPAVPPHLLGGPQPSFCDSEEHNALRAHQERQRRSLVTDADNSDDKEISDGR